MRSSQHKALASYLIHHYASVAKNGIRFETEHVVPRQSLFDNPSNRISDHIPIGNSAPIGGPDRELGMAESQTPSSTVDVRDREREWQEWGQSLTLGLDSGTNGAHDSKAASNSRALS
ncbi:hypothetical protein PHSY_001633 [Pseudozyma hubeiensis SY62]|uniref:Uncharacterized protein n=1 Tax=Pseudozyma hubeiensis (strain SY62) TaxID=1305764 RepID=R9NZ80_PSEHS|nr:hypothetical protein PHSY_001633 [Pseudozyma hubeiensis SY62]GAC94064.1 hypothetical protein PHSY_001633 [Pseudozyma hubeiensis SY62]